MKKSRRAQFQALVMEDNHNDGHINIPNSDQDHFNHMSTLVDSLEMSKENVEGIYQIKETYL